MTNISSEIFRIATTIAELSEIHDEKDIRKAFSLVFEDWVCVQIVEVHEDRSKIGAIKFVREVLSLSLVEAKDFVEGYTRCIDKDNYIILTQGLPDLGYAINAL